MVRSFCDSLMNYLSGLYTSDTWFLNEETFWTKFLKENFGYDDSLERCLEWPLGRIKDIGQGVN